MWGVGKVGKAGKAMHSVLQDLDQSPYSEDLLQGAACAQGGSAVRVRCARADIYIFIYIQSLNI